MSAAKPAETWRQSGPVWLSGSLSEPACLPACLTACRFRRGPRHLGARAGGRAGGRGGGAIAVPPSPSLTRPRPPPLFLVSSTALARNGADTARRGQGTDAAVGAGGAASAAGPGRAGGARAAPRGRPVRVRGACGRETRAALGDAALGDWGRPGVTRAATGERGGSLACPPVRCELARVRACARPHSPRRSRACACACICVLVCVRALSAAGDARRVAALLGRSMALERCACAAGCLDNACAR